MRRDFIFGAVASFIIGVVAPWPNSISFVVLIGGNEVTANPFSNGNLYAKEARQFPPNAISIWKFCTTSDHTVIAPLNDDDWKRPRA
jgi:hypothetical protein